MSPRYVRYDVSILTSYVMRHVLHHYQSYTSLDWTFQFQRMWFLLLCKELDCHNIIVMILITIHIGFRYLFICKCKRMRIMNNDAIVKLAVTCTQLPGIGLDRTGHMSFLTGQDRTPKFAGLTFLNILPTKYRLSIVLKVRHLGRKTSGFWTVRILKICRTWCPVEPYPAGRIRQKI